MYQGSEKIILCASVQSFVCLRYEEQRPQFDCQSAVSKGEIQLIQIPVKHKQSHLQVNALNISTQSYLHAIGYSNTPLSDMCVCVCVCLRRCVRCDIIYIYCLGASAF